MDPRKRLGWVRLEAIGDAGAICRRCSISRPTSHKWWRRYRAGGDAGLHDNSRHPRPSLERKVFGRREALILDLCRGRKLSIERLRGDLLRGHGLALAVDTLQSVAARVSETVV